MTSYHVLTIIRYESKHTLTNKEGKMMPLNLADPGVESVIKKVGGNLIVNVKESRVAISKEMAAKIYI